MTGVFLAMFYELNIPINCGEIMKATDTNEECVMALHLPIGPLKHALGWSRYRDMATD